MLKSPIRRLGPERSVGRIQYRVRATGLGCVFEICPPGTPMRVGPNHVRLDQVEDSPV